MKDWDTDAHEFMSVGLTDEDFQNYLSTIKIGTQSVMDKIVEFVRRSIGLDPKYTSALDELVRVTDNLLNESELEMARKMEDFGAPPGSNVKFVLGIPTTATAPVAGTPKPLIEKPLKSLAEPSEATGAGKDALDALAAMNRKVEDQPKSFYENIKNYWNNAFDNPGMAIEDAKKAATQFSDKIQTWTFSSDAALNNNLRRAILESYGQMSDKVRNLLNISTSQAVGADILASGALLEGRLRYDDEVQKWEVVKDKYNQIALENSINDFAKKYNMTYQEAELVAHMAFEARRTQSLKDFNASIANAPQEIKALQNLYANLTGTDPTTKAQKAEVKAAIKRFENLSKQKPKLIHLTDDQISTGLDFFKSMPELNDTVDIWQGMRNNAKDALVESGLWSDEYAEQMMSNIDYVPFQREFDEEEAKGGDKNYLSGLMVKAKEFKMTGSERPVANIVDNMAKWIEYSYNRSIRNSQAKAMIDVAMGSDLQHLGIAQKVPHPIKNANIVRIWRDGKEEFYNMKDPLFVDAFAGIQAVSVPTIKFFSKFANILRESVVMNPLFAVSQVPQDAFSAIFTSGLSPQYALRIPALAVKEFVKTLRRTSVTHEELKKYRAVGYTDFTSDLARRDAEVYAGVKPPPGGWGKVKNMLKHISMASDNAVRQAVYEASMSAGLTRGEAIEKAFEVFNVRRRGTSTTLRVASQVIPFFNAYLAVQNVAYKTITGTGISPTERKAGLQTLAMTTGSVMALSLLYAMMNGDDDDYLKKPTTVRDRLLMIPGTGGLSIPLRNDIFTIPKIITEHMYLLMTNNATEDGRKFRDSMASALTSSLMAPTPVPQAVKPALEVALNYDFFQNRNLINPFMLKEDVSRQFNESTSELGKVLGKTGLIAPINADHIIRGMFGSVGGLTLMLTNPILHTDPNVEKPTIGWHDVLASVPGSSGFISKENQTGLKRDFYILKDEVDKASATFNDIKSRTPNEAGEYMKSREHQMRVGMHTDIDRIAKNLSNIQKAIAVISNRPNMDADKKEKQINNLQKQEQLILKNIDVKRLRAMAML
jgi:hypothetical protein